MPLPTFLLLVFSVRSTSSFHLGGDNGLKCWRSVNVPLHTACTPVGTTLIAATKYGRGAEIWPECNESPIALADSFPGGNVPPAAKERIASSVVSTDDKALAAVIEAEDDAAPEPLPVTKASRRKRRMVRATVSRLLRSAALASSQSVASDSVTDDFRTYGVPTPIDKFPAAVVLALLGMGLVEPTHVLFVIFMSGYFTILGTWCRAPSSARNNPNGVVMPSLPPQGHVPSLVSNPLGTLLTNSTAYRMWLRIGALVGLLAPLIATGWYMTKGGNNVGARAVAGPVFLLCSQALSEQVARRFMAPLPLRILVPVSYNAMRLGPIWEWALSLAPLGYAGRILAALNLLYWSTNLFAFLLPTATIRYLRAHFFCVEAAEVTTRDGGEGAIGLLP